MRLTAILSCCIAICLSASQVRGDEGVEPKAMENLKVIVAATNDEWTDTGLRVYPGDVVVIASSGTIQIGEWSGEVTADGNGAGEGALTAKIGVGAAFRVGDREVLFPKEEGSFKLRVRDGSYRDNRGKFEVMVLYIPQAKIPGQKMVEAD